MNIRFFRLSLLLSIILSCNHLATTAQTSDFILEHLNNSSYSLDTSASAIILLSKAEVILDAVYGTKMKITRIIKILRKDGIDNWGDLKESVSFANISKVKGYTYNIENGNVIKVEIAEDFIFKEKLNRNRQELKLGFTDVKVGSVVEINFHVTYQGFYLPSWSFQSIIPTLRSEYKLYNSNNTKFQAEINGRHSLHSHQVSRNEREHIWTMINIPAFKLEPFMPPPNQYLSTLSFSFNSNVVSSWGTVWESIVNHDNYYNVVRTENKLLAHVADSLIQQHSNDTIGLLKGASNYIKQKIKWNGYIGIFAKSPELILESKSGSSASINLLLLNLLAKCKIQGKAVLLSTRGNEINIYKPSTQEFNYVVALIKLKSGNLLLDATDKFMAFNQIPAKCLNRLGFVLSEDKYEWIKTTSNLKFKKIAEINMHLDASSNATTQIDINKFGFAASNTRFVISQLGEEEYLETFNEGKLWTVSSDTIINKDDTDSHLIEKYTITGDEGIITRQGSNVLIDPFTFTKHINAFNQEERIYPIDLEIPIEDMIILKLTIPDDFQFESYPKSKGMALPNGDAKLILNTTLNGNTLFITYNVQISKTYYEALEYKGLAEFFANVVSIENELIILSKK